MIAIILISFGLGCLVGAVALIRMPARRDELRLIPAPPPGPLPALPKLRAKLLNIDGEDLTRLVPVSEITDNLVRFEFASKDALRPDECRVVSAELDNGLPVHMDRSMQVNFFLPDTLILDVNLQSIFCAHLARPMTHTEPADPAVSRDGTEITSTAQQAGSEEAGACSEAKVYR